MSTVKSVFPDIHKIHNRESNQFLYAVKVECLLRIVVASSASEKVTALDVYRTLHSFLPSTFFLFDLRACIQKPDGKLTLLQPVTLHSVLDETPEQFMESAFWDLKRMVTLINSLRTPPLQSGPHLQTLIHLVDQCAVKLSHLNMSEKMVERLSAYLPLMLRFNPNKEKNKAPHSSFHYYVALISVSHFHDPKTFESKFNFLTFGELPSEALSLPDLWSTTVDRMVLSLEHATWLALQKLALRNHQSFHARELHRSDMLDHWWFDSYNRWPSKSLKTILAEFLIPHSVPHLATLYPVPPQDFPLAALKKKLMVPTFSFETPTPSHSSAAPPTPSSSKEQKEKKKASPVTNVTEMTNFSPPDSPSPVFIPLPDPDDPPKNEEKLEDFSPTILKPGVPASACSSSSLSSLLLSTFKTGSSKPPVMVDLTSQESSSPPANLIISPPPVTVTQPVNDQQHNQPSAALTTLTPDGPPVPLVTKSSPPPLSSSSTPKSSLENLKVGFLPNSSSSPSSSSAAAAPLNESGRKRSLTDVFPSFEDSKKRIKESLIKNEKFLPLLSQCLGSQVGQIISNGWSEGLLLLPYRFVDLLENERAHIHQKGWKLARVDAPETLAQLRLALNDRFHRFHLSMEKMASFEFTGVSNPEDAICFAFLPLIFTVRLTGLDGDLLSFFRTWYRSSSTAVSSQQDTTASQVFSGLEIELNSLITVRYQSCLKISFPFPMALVIECPDLPEFTYHQSWNTSLFAFFRWRLSNLLQRQQQVWRGSSTNEAFAVPISDCFVSPFSSLSQFRQRLGASFSSKPLPEFHQWLNCSLTRCGVIIRPFASGLDSLYSLPLHSVPLSLRGSHLCENHLPFAVYHATLHDPSVTVTCLSPPGSPTL